MPAASRPRACPGGISPPLPLRGARSQRSCTAPAGAQVAILQLHRWTCGPLLQAVCASGGPVPGFLRHPPHWELSAQDWEWGGSHLQGFFPRCEFQDSREVRRGPGRQPQTPLPGLEEASCHFWELVWAGPSSCGMWISLRHLNADEPTEVGPELPSWSLAWGNRAAGRKLWTLISHSPATPRQDVGHPKQASLQGWSGQRAAPSEAPGRTSCRDGLASFCLEWATRSMTTGRPRYCRDRAGAKSHIRTAGLFPQKPRFSRQ